MSTVPVNTDISSSAFWVDISDGKNDRRSAERTIANETGPAINGTGEDDPLDEQDLAMVTSGEESELLQSETELAARVANVSIEKKKKKVNFNINKRNPKRFRNSTSNHSSPTTPKSVSPSDLSMLNVVLNEIRETRAEMRESCANMANCKESLEKKIDLVAVSCNDIGQRVDAISTVQSKESVILNELMDRVKKLEEQDGTKRPYNGDELEIYQRERDLVIRGIPLARRVVQDELRKHILNLAKALHHEITERGLERVRQVLIKKKDKRTESMLVVRFSTRMERNAFFEAYFKKKNLSTLDIGYSTQQRIFINPNLTPRIESLRLKATEHKSRGLFLKCQVYDGHILLTTLDGERRVHIHNIDELDEAVKLAETGNSYKAGHSASAVSTENPFGRGKC